MRTLATIQTITDLTPIEGADKIEKATILGREVVVEKGIHKVGEQILYFEIDSFLPEVEQFEFLRSRCYKNYNGKGGFRLKTIKLKGQVSQGLILPLHQFNISEFKYDNGKDLTEKLGVVKYDTELLKELKEKENFQREYSRKWKGKGLKGLYYRFIYLAKIKLGYIKFDKTFPSFIPKTDETRVQILQDILTQYKGTDCYITEKLDGSSMTCYIKNGKFGVCSRNLDLVNKDNKFWKTALKLDIENKMRLNRPTGEMAIQGELIGTGIQGNKYGLEDYDYYIFNVYDIKRQCYYSTKGYGFKEVPYLGEMSLTNNIHDLVELSKGKSKLNNKTEREGIVIRPMEEINNVYKMGRLSFKVINPDFLLKYDD